MKHNNINFTVEQTVELHRMVVREFGKSTKRITKKRIKRLIMEVIELTVERLRTNR